MCTFIIFKPFSPKKKTFQLDIFLSYHLGFFFYHCWLDWEINLYFLYIINIIKKTSWSVHCKCQYVKDGRIFGWCAAKRWLSYRCLKRLGNPSTFVAMCLEWTSISASTLQNSKVTPQFVLSSDYFLIFYLIFVLDLFVKFLFLFNCII
jgi:hypothetical protein